MIRKTSLFILFALISLNIAIGQSLSRYSDPNYMWTDLDETFDAPLDRLNVWDVRSHFKRDLGFLVDNPLNIVVQNGNLELTMRYVPNYLDSIWRTNGWQRVYSNYTGAEISTKKLYHYGVYECRARFAKQQGSWPAFWLIGGDGISCELGGGLGSEIDIAELFSYSPFPQLCHVVHRYYPPVDCNVSNNVQKDNNSYFVGMSEQYETYKCVWTPFKIEYYINNVLQHTVNNVGQEWFPSLKMSVILSQQVFTPFNIVGQQLSPIVPQISSFDYVRVRQFFLAPEITVPNTICTTGIATMDVDSQASNITWQLSPSSLFSTSSGTGSTANIVAANTVSGVGKIIYTFQMPSGESFTAEKSFWVGTPPVPQINSNTSYVWATSYFPSPSKVFTIYTGEEIDFFDENTNTLGGLVQNSGTWTWDIDAGGASHEDFDYGSGGRMCFFYEPCSVRVKAKLSNLCGETDWSDPVYIEVLQQLTMSLSPNPGGDETAIELNSGGNNRSSNTIDWELEIYDTTQSLKTKVSKIKGKSITINTSNWKDGVYLVRAKIGKKQISEKLVVKH